jgi:hypothetical protein
LFTGVAVVNGLLDVLGIVEEADTVTVDDWVEYGIYALDTVANNGGVDLYGLG